MIRTVIEMSSEDEDLAKTLAKVQYHYQQAIEELATDGKSSHNYHLMQAFFVLEDYLMEDADSGGRSDT